MYLICLNENNKRISKTWLRFDVNVNDHSISTFENSKIFHCFLTQRIINQLNLKLQQFFNKMRLKNDKIVDVVNFCEITWNKDEFYILIHCTMLNIKDDLILNENFWQNYRLNLDYNTLKVKIYDKKMKHLFANMNFNRSRFQILENESSKFDCVSRRTFQKFIQKNAKCYFYVICQVKSQTKGVKLSKKIYSHSIYYRALKIEQSIESRHVETIQKRFFE